MNRKAIKAVLKKKFNKWIDTIDDENVRKDVIDNTIITGGAIVSLLLNEPPKDYDVYFKTKEAAKRVAQYYVDKFNAGHDNVAVLLDGAKNYDLLKNDLPSIDGLPAILESLDKDRIKICFTSGEGVAGEDGVDLTEPFEDVYDVLPDELEEQSAEEPKPPYRPVFLSPNAITLSDKIQIIIRFYGEVDKIHENYDYTHCTCSWESKSGTLVLPAPALESMLSKQLHYQGSKYPVCSVVRMRKYLKRGWHINAGQILKMLFQVGALDLTDVNVLEDQLVGVDTAYFNMLIKNLRDRQDEDDSFKPTQEYISAIIDKIF